MHKQGSIWRVADGSVSAPCLDEVCRKSAGFISDGRSAPLQVYWLNEKYKPRKPKYFNRVHTGYEWNKYNQTHYDQDNPPPKVVQGYKFNIFYPDLMDKETAPEYVLGKVRICLVSLASLTRTRMEFHRYALLLILTLL